MMYSNGGFWGMNLIWWCIWMAVIFWIFAIPYGIPGQRFKKETAFDILRKRFAAGELTAEEYKERKKLLEIDLVKV